MKRDLLSINDLSADELVQILDVALALKLPTSTPHPVAPLAGASAAMIFEKPSLRTRLSFELALVQLGAHAIALSGVEVGLNVRESAGDVGRAVSGYVDLVIGRVFAHETLEALAASASVPVINALSDREHTCQALADLLTMRERFGTIRGRTLAFIGDGNNVAHSLMAACSKVGVNVCVASPGGYAPRDESLVLADTDATMNGSWVELCQDPRVAVRDADVVYTDGWYSMGQEHEAEQRRILFRDFQINQNLLQAAPSHAVTMHCLPAHRGEEITDDVLDGESCLAFEQARNRLYAQKAVILWALQPDVFDSIRETQ